MAAPASDTTPRASSDALLGIGFVLVWCTGYIAGKVVVVHAAPLTSLVLRFGIAALVFAALALVGRAGRCRRADLLHSAVTGVLMLALHFGAVYVAFQWGANAGVSALVIGAMPLLVALVATLDGSERLGAWRWFGMALGLVGVALVVADRVDGATPLKAWAMLGLGLAGITAGTLYQKRHAAHLDMRLGLTVQNAAAALVLLPFAAREGFRIDDSAAFHGALAWLVLVNSIGGFALLFLLIRRGAATRVAALFFLMPPVTAVFGHFTLGEHLTWLKAAGFACAALGVWLATREEPPAG
ncbi:MULTISPECIES: DMT family transporter [Pseudoxanthomonas]|jgi:drug/metabolite transporter (DMT)-like permease|uniref:DMT family transporter n=1 Tax=Pseudoxanthomonas winnipegensis TaxID=2480810 RepID=A0A4Q8L7Y6_9GAMM|nr:MULTISPECIES: DMT family transporter [Pseudoxanthomonas]PZP62447.1 MAG: EamA/RhaT family transporter [Pseudoxanthomonas spadix]TAA24318.1 DMT family transporter [Pseudoxanthomonas winnipegensis]TMN17711.1 DMT family transporter [Pseudoxanthomonas sp. X-1]UAY75855.1 DMT family transporter [Pseudoxanthomonas sp. X-1]